MKLSFIAFLVIVLLPIFGTSFVQGQSVKTSKKTVTGRIIDESRNPIKGCVIRLYYKNCRSCKDYDLKVYKTSEVRPDIFYFEVETDASEAYIFIDDVDSEGFSSLMFNVPEDVRQKVSALKGLKFSIGKRKNDLGNIIIPQRNSKIIIDLASIFGKPQENFVNKVIVKIKDEKGNFLKEWNGKIIDFYFHSEYAFDETLTKLKIALPVRGNSTSWGIVVEYYDKSKDKKTFEYKLELSKLSCIVLSIENGKPIETNCN